MKSTAGSALVLGAVVWTAVTSAAQTPVGALAIDDRQGDQYGWAVDYETASSARTNALSECGSGCSVVLTFGRCAAYAADREEGSTAFGWAESYDSATGARQGALAECGSRGGSSCIVRVWGCNGHVVEEGLGLGRAARREIQEGLQAAGFDPGGADGMFGPRTRAAIRSWQTSRGARATGYLDGASMMSLRPSVAGQPTFRQREPARATAAPPSVSGARQEPPSVSAAPAAPADLAALAVSAGQQQPPSEASTEVEVVFWQSIANSTNPAEFEAYLSQFPNGVFRALAEIRLVALESPEGTAGNTVAGGGAAHPEPGTVFRPDRTCADQPAGGPCWTEIAGQRGCHVWNESYDVNASVTWTGACSGGLARGMGSLTWVSDDRELVDTGHLQDGKMDGHWVLQRPPLGILEGPMVDGVPQGHWVFRTDGWIEEGPMVDGVPHGEWFRRWDSGGNREPRRFRWEHGELVEPR